MKKRQFPAAAFTDHEMYPTLLITVAALIGAAAFWFFVGKPTISACWFYSSYHIYCPGCGCTRSLIALMRGDILHALYYNPAVPFTAGLILLYLASQTIWRLRDRRGWVLHYSSWWFSALFLILAGNCVLRNVLWFCFAIPL
ncbi:MAG: DUF2752 domain-containing protein [Ruminococcaceae bacterium]|nr:DUF2752 domain-containing protein [Oscillospiraceae bacterium]